MDMILGKSKVLNSFSYLVTYVVDWHLDCLIEAIPMCTYNICLFYTKVIQ